MRRSVSCQTWHLHLDDRPKVCRSTELRRRAGGHQDLPEWRWHRTADLGRRRTGNSQSHRQLQQGAVADPGVHRRTLSVQHPGGLRVVVGDLIGAVDYDLEKRSSSRNRVSLIDRLYFVFTSPGPRSILLLDVCFSKAASYLSKRRRRPCKHVGKPGNARLSQF